MNAGKLLAIVFTVLMVGSLLAVPIGAAGGSPPTEETDEEPAVVTDTDDVNDEISTAVESVDEPTDAVIDDAITDRSGTVDVIVRLEEVNRPVVLQSADPVTALQSHAERSQAPLVDYAAATPDVEVRNQYWLTNAALVRVDADRLDELAAQPNVVRVSENVELSAPEPVEFGADADDPATTYGLEQIDAPAVWDEYDTMGEGVSVAVLDTGVAPDHPDIDIDPDDWAEFDEAGDVVGDSEPHDTGYHGTHTSGTVTGGNASGEYIGVAPEATLMHGLVLPDGSGSIAQIIGGMEWAVAEDADVISMSLGAPGYHADLIDPVRNAQDAGVAVVGSSGNDGPGTSGSPGNVYDSFAVGASNEDENIAAFSSGEIVDTDDDWSFAAPSDWPDRYVVPDVAAPGEGVRSAVPSGTFDDPDAIYGYADGTSMAAPHVSGAIALALSASDDDHSPEEITSVFERSAWKPDGATFPDQQDNRYGHGIVDVKVATDRVAAAGGIEGTVTDPDGNAIDAEVVLDGSYPVETDADGEYEVRTAPGEYTLEAHALGYQTDSATVTVGEAFETVDLELEPTVEAAVVEDQADGVRAGELVTATVEYVNAEEVTIDLQDGYDADSATLYVDGSETAFGETIAFDGPTDGETTVTLETTANVTGELGLEYAFEGLGDTDEVTTGPTDVFEDVIDVGVVDAEIEGISGTPEFADDIVDQLENTLSAQYDVEFVEAADAADAADDYDAFVVQKFELENYPQVREFLEATEGSSTGVIFLDQHGDRSHAITQLSHATGNPEYTNSDFHMDYFGGDTSYYEVLEEHPVFEGVAEPGETIPVIESAYVQWTWFDGYHGGTTLAEVGLESQGISGDGLAVDDFRRYVLAGGMGHQHNAYSSSYEDGAKTVLANSVEYVTQPAPSMSLEADQDTQIAPGETTTVELSVRDLEQLTVSLADDSTLSTDDLGLTVDGKVADFDQALAYDGLTSGSFEIELSVDEDAAGSVSLEIDGVAGGQTASGLTGPTAVYEPPLEVPHDVDSVQEAVDLAPNGAQIVVDDGVYEEYVHVTNSGQTIVAADGAEPVIEAPSDLTENETMRITGPDVTVSGLTVDGGGDRDGVVVRNGDYATLTDLTVRNADRGIRTAGSNQLSVANNHVTDSTTGIELRHWYNHDVTNNLIEDVETGVYVWENRNLAITDNVVRNASDVGIDVRSRMLDVDGNAVENATTGVAITGEETVVTNNTVSGADVGLYSDPYTWDFEIRDNEFTADTGLHFHGNVEGEATHNVVNATDATLFDAPDLGDGALLDAWETPEDLHFRFNDVSASENVAATENASSGFDARLNYLGENGTIDDAFAGSLWIDPFLTASPDEVDAGEETTQIAIGLELEAGETTAIGVPAQTDATIRDVFPNDLDGVVYGFDADDQSWTQRTANEPVNALEPLLIVPEDDATVTLSFETDEPVAPGQRTLAEGWNFVSSPVYDDLESAYETGTADHSLASAPFEAPGRQIGPAGELGDSPYVADDATEPPSVSPFEGTFLFVTEDGAQPAHLSTDPTMESLYTALGLDVQVVESPGDPGGVSQVYSAAESGADGDRLTSLVLRTLERDLAAFDSEDDRAGDVLNESVEGLLENAPDDHRETIAAAIEDAVAIVGEHGDRWTDDPIAERNASVSGAVVG